LQRDPTYRLCFLVIPVSTAGCRHKINFLF
jgi:hypothetical protein